MLRVRAATPAVIKLPRRKVRVSLRRGKPGNVSASGMRFKMSRDPRMWKQGVRKQMRLASARSYSGTRAIDVDAMPRSRYVWKNIRVSGLFSLFLS